MGAIDGLGRSYLLPFPIFSPSLDSFSSLITLYMFFYRDESCLLHKWYLYFLASCLMSRILERTCACPCYGLPLIARKTARLRARLVPMAAGLTCAAGGFLTRYVQRRPIVAHAQICASLFSLVDFMAIEWKCNHFSLNQPPIPWKGGGKTNTDLDLYFQNFLKSVSAMTSAFSLMTTSSFSFSSS